MKELLQSIFDSSNDRIKNPFIGSFATAFIVFNWRPIFLLLFSDAIIEDKIVVINHEYCNPWAIIIPIAIAICYIILLPYVNLFFDWILLSYNDKNKERINQSILNSLIQKKSEAKHEREIAEELAGTSEINTLKGQIERLNSENLNLTKQNEETFERYSKSLETFKKQEEQMNTMISNLNNQATKLFQDDNKRAEEVDVLRKAYLKGLNKQDIETFMKVADLINKKSKSLNTLNVDNPAIKKMIDAELILHNSITNQYKLSALGDIVYANNLPAPF